MLQRRRLAHARRSTSLVREGALPDAALLGVAGVRAGACVADDRPLSASHRRASTRSRRAGSIGWRCASAPSPIFSRAPATSPGWSANGTTARSTRAIIRTAAASTSSPDSPADGSRTISGSSIATARSRAADGRYLTDVFTDEAVEFIRRHRGEPFFLHLAYNAPHFPFEAPEAELRPFIESGNFTTAVSAIYAMMRCMDRGIARVLEELDSLRPRRQHARDVHERQRPAVRRQGRDVHRPFQLRLRRLEALRLRRRNPAADGAAVAGGTRRAAARSTRCFTSPTGCRRCSPRRAPSRRAILKLDGVNVLPSLQGERGKVRNERFWQWNRYKPDGECNAAMRDGKLEAGPSRDPRIDVDHVRRFSFGCPREVRSR